MKFCKKCHKRMVEVLTTMMDLKNRCLCDDLTRIEEGSEAVNDIKVGVLTSKKVSKGHRRKLLKDLKDLKGTKEIKDRKGYKGLRVDLGMMVHKGLRVIKVIRGCKGQKVSKVTRETRVIRVTQVHRDHKDLKATKVIPGAVVGYPTLVL